MIDPFVSSAFFLYVLKISGTLTVFRCFQGVERGCIGNKWVKLFVKAEACLGFYKTSVMGHFCKNIKPFTKNKVFH